MAMKRVWFRGKVLNQRTVDMITRAEQRLGFQLYILQGSYNAGGVSASAGTHDGGGAVDVSPTSNPSKVVRTLREVGFAAWHRLPSQGPWTEHIHAIAIGDAELSSGAKLQVQQYYAGLNGLANHAPDDGPRLHPIPVWPVPLQKVSSIVLYRQFRAKHPAERRAVKVIQQGLNRKVNSHLVVDGVAGPKTRAAYKVWQKRIGAKVTGVPRRWTINKLGVGYFKAALLDSKK